MLDFRQNRNGRNANAGNERRLLLRLTLLLGVVFVLFDWARQPSSWNWFDRLVASSNEDASDAIDNRLDAVPQGDFSKDVFVVPKAAAKQGELQSRTEFIPFEEQKATERNKFRSTNDLAASPGTKQEAEAPRTRTKALEYFPGVQADMFKSIRDDSPSSEEEQSVALPLLDILNRTDADRLRGASVGPIAYAQLFRQPEQYRGRLVTVSGTVRRANPIELYPNEYGLKKYYQVWLFPADNPSSPIVVYCLELPEGFPTGMKLAEDVEATGFFLKRWAYAAQDAFRTAPAILAKSLEWRERPAASREASVDSRWILAVVAISVLSAVAAAWTIYLRTRPSRIVLPDEPPDFDLLRRMDNNQQSRNPNVEDV